MEFARWVCTYLPGKEIRVMEFTCTISVKSCNYVIYNWWPHCRCLAGRRIRIKRKPELFRQSEYIYISEELLGVSCVPNVLIQRICTRNRSRIIVRRKYYDSHSLSLHGGNISRTALCKGELLSIELESFT